MADRHEPLRSGYRLVGLGLKTSFEREEVESIAEEDRLVIKMDLHREIYFTARRSPEPVVKFTT